MHHITVLDEVFQKVDTLLDVERISEHLEQGTAATYYNSIIQQVAVDIMVIPAIYIANNDNIDIESSELIECLKQIAETISKFFWDKTVEDVAADMTKAIDECPVEDIRTAYILKAQGKLN